MKVIVVYESMYGNTKEIAQAIAEGLSSHADVAALEVGDATGRLDDVGLLVVGGPTHGHGMSRRGTRETAAKNAPDRVISRRIGLREWLTSLPAAPGALAAAFDTRFDKPRWLTGSAARGAARRLRRLGYQLAAPPESFWILHASGPLAAGERDRARRWGEMLGVAVMSRSRGPSVR